MNVIFAFCGVAILGWVSPDSGQPVAPLPERSLRDNLPAQPTSQPVSPQRTYPQAVAARPPQVANEGFVRQPRMPVPPTDPRTYSYGNLPLPPTMNDSGMLPSGGMAPLGPRVNSGATAENGGHRPSNQKAFEHYRAEPAVSPYTLLNSNTDNGTINPYMAYVRPAQEQQQANQDFDRAASNSDGGANQPAPGYMRAFQNYGAYYPTGR
jgi:hypothetical protein